MRAIEARTIRIEEYLAYEGFKPQHSKGKGTQLWYNSPIRDGDSNPSFKVDTQKNLWYDHGIGKGGNTLDLAIEFCRGSIRDALLRLDRTNLYKSHGYNSTPLTDFTPMSDIIQKKRIAVEKEKDETSHIITKVCDIQHPALLQYIQKRKINIEVANKYLKEIYFKPRNAQKSYFALGWKAGDGYQARNSLFKGYVGNGKDVSYLKKPGADECFIFEGDWDFMSYLSEKGIKTPYFSTIVLNAGGLKARALPHILAGKYKTVKLFMDNDAMGDECLAFYQETLSNLELIDMRQTYEGFKDHNEWFMSSSRI